MISKTTFGSLTKIPAKPKAGTPKTPTTTTPTAKPPANPFLTSGGGKNPFPNGLDITA